MKVFPVVFTCDSNYFKFTKVAIASLLINRNRHLYYEINILSEDISNEQKAEAQRWVKRFSNTGIVFHDLNRIDREKFYLNSYMSVSTYYRFFIPALFKDYERILYLDSDLIVDADISDLHSMDFDDTLALACSSPYIKNIILAGNDPDYPVDYFSEVLKMPDPLQYFNAGVMMLNLQKINKERTADKLFEALAEIPEPKLQDQDILNSVFSRNGGIKLLPEKYNFTRTIILSKKRILLERVKRKLGLTRENPWFRIYHYVGEQKPWQKKGIDGELFYYYAKKSGLKEFS